MRRVFSVLAVAGSLVSAVSIPWQPDHVRLSRTTLAVTEARVCDGILSVKYVAIVDGKVRDIGQPLVEVQGFGARAYGKTWIPVDRLPGATSPVRVKVDDLNYYWHGVRVVLPDSDGKVASWGALEDYGCEPGDGGSR